MKQQKLLFGALMFMLLGCPSPATGPDAMCSFELQWGPEQSSFAPFLDGDNAEITLGFQGFRYIRSIARFEGSDANRAIVQFQIAVDGHDAYVQPGALLPTRADNGGRLQEELLVFFNDIPMPELVGRGASISALATANGCTANFAATVTLVDEDEAIEQE